MRKNIKKKSLIVEDIINNIKESKSFFLFNFKNISANDFNDIKKNNFDKGIKIKIYRNTLIKRALEKLNLNLNDYDSDMQNQTAFIFSKEEELYPLNILNNLSAKYNSQIKFGYLEKELLPSERVKSLFGVSSKESLIQKFLYILKSPITKFSFSVSEIVKKQKKQ